MSYITHSKTKNLQDKAYDGNKSNPNNNDIITINEYLDSIKNQTDLKNTNKNNNIPTKNNDRTDIDSNSTNVILN